MADTTPTSGCSYFKFAARFCNELDKTKNTVFSPLLAAEVTICANAVKRIVPYKDVSGDVIDSSSDSNIPVLSSMLSPKLKLLKGIKYRRSSKIYVHIWHHELNRKQKQIAKEMFHVKIKNIDFCNSIDAAECINRRVEKKTKGKITGFFKHTDFDVATNIILVNGLYFKGIWHMKFDPDKTEETIFYINNNETVNVFLMCRKEKYMYKDSGNLDAQMVLLPLKQKEAHILIVLPKRITGLNAMIQRLAEGYDLTEEIENMTNSVQVIVRIPRFKIESEVNLVEVLRKLGVTTVFDKAVQKVLVEVNEEGWEPKPEQITCRFIPRWKPRPIEFTADRPFILAVVYENVPVIWVTFRGRFE